MSDRYIEPWKDEEKNIRLEQLKEVVTKTGSQYRRKDNVYNYLLFAANATR